MQCLKHKFFSQGTLGEECLPTESHKKITPDSMKIKEIIDEWYGYWRPSDEQSAGYRPPRRITTQSSLQKTHLVAAFAPDCSSQILLQWQVTVG